jgi:hypothetical protein
MDNPPRQQEQHQHQLDSTVNDLVDQLVTQALKKGNFRKYKMMIMFLPL